MFGKSVSNESAKLLIYGLTALATISIVALVVVATGSDDASDASTTALEAQTPR